MVMKLNNKGENWFISQKYHIVIEPILLKGITQIQCFFNKGNTKNGTLESKCSVFERKREGLKNR